MLQSYKILGLAKLQESESYEINESEPKSAWFEFGSLASTTKLVPKTACESELGADPNSSGDSNGTIYRVVRKLSKLNRNHPKLPEL